MRKWFIAGVLAAGAVALSGCGAQAYAARVNGETISQQSFFDTLDAASKGQGGDQLKGVIPDSFASESAVQILQNDIMGVIAQQEVERRGLTPDIEASRAQFSQGQSAQAFLALPEALRDQIVRTNAAFAALQEDINTAGVAEPDEEAVRQAFESDPEQFRQVCVKILVTFEQAQAAVARQRIVAGEDFGAVAASVLPPGATQADPGAVRCLPVRNIEQQAPTLAEALAAASPGELLQPVDAGQGQGFLVVMLTEKREPSLEGARAFLAEQLANNPQAAVQFEITRILRSADVEVNPQFGVWTGETVVPPSAPQATGEEELPGGESITGPSGPGGDASDLQPQSGDLPPDQVPSE